MTNPQTLSIVVIAIAGVLGALASTVWAVAEQRMIIATMIMGATASTTTALLAAFKAEAAKEVASKSIKEVQQLNIAVDGRLTALIEANERAFAAEKLVAHAAGVAEGKIPTQTT